METPNSARKPIRDPLLTIQHRNSVNNSTGAPKIAIVGAGYWGKKVIREVLELERSTGSVRLGPVVDDSPSNLQECRQEFGPLDYRLNYSDHLSDKSFDAAHICTPNSTHFEIASAFIEHGKSVLIEKPMALNSKDAFRLVELAKEKNLVLCAGHIHRFNNGVRGLRRALSEGLIGRPYYLRLQWTSFTSPSMERDVISDLAPHPFDICNLLLGAWPTTITCRGNAYRTKMSDEVAFINCQYDTGLAANIEVSWLDREKRRSVTVIGSEGMAYLDCIEQRVMIRQHDNDMELTTSPSNTLAGMIAHFADCIRANHNKDVFANLSDGLIGANVVALVEAAKLSSRENRIVNPRLATVETRLVSQDGKSLVELKSGSNKETFDSKSDRENFSRMTNDFLDLYADSKLLSHVMEVALEGRLKGSRHRVGILSSLSGADKSPKEIAAEAGLNLSNLGKYLRDLVDYGLVERKTPLDIRKGRIYGLTTKGRSILVKVTRKSTP